MELIFGSEATDSEFESSSVVEYPMTTTAWGEYSSSNE